MWTYAEGLASDGSLGGSGALGEDEPPISWSHQFTSFDASDGTYSNGVLLRWSGGDNADWFGVFRDNKDLGVTLSAGSREYLDTTAKTDVVYSYFVRGYDRVGYVWTSTDSGWRGKAAPSSPPPTPTGISASDGTYILPA